MRRVFYTRYMLGAPVDRAIGDSALIATDLSGTSPKAGGRRYLHRFATERTVSVDTTAAGGNATLLSLQEKT